MSTAKKALIGAGVGLALLLAAGGGGAIYGHQAQAPLVEAAESRADELQQELTTARAGFTRELAEVRAELATEQRRANMLEARRQLAVALYELDRRNFGLAQRHCRAAAGNLADAAAGDEALTELSASLESYRFELGGDFERSRQQLRRFARSVDRLVAPPATDALDDEDLPLPPAAPPAPETEAAAETEAAEQVEPAPSAAEGADAPSDSTP